MNSVKISRTLMANVISTVFAANGSPTKPAIGNQSYPSMMRIFKGPMPTPAELTIDYLTNVRALDNLVTFVYTNCFNAYSVNGNGGVLKNPPAASAAKSGTAAWFVLYSLTSGGALYNAILGTISDVAGNGDLKLTSTEIVAGQQYRVQTLTLGIPYEFNF